MGIDALQTLEQAVDELCGLDVDTLTDAEVQEVMLAVARGRAQLSATSARLTSRWDSSCVWRSDGSRSAAARLARELNWSLREARTEVRRGRALRTMPLTAAALADGKIGGDHVELLARANDDARRKKFAESEEELLGYCTSMRFAGAKVAVQHWVQVVDPDAAERNARDLLEKTSLNTAVTLDDAVHLEGLLDPVGGATFLEVLRRLERDLYRSDKRDNVTRSATARRAAALVDMAKRAAVNGPAGKSVEPLVMILVGDKRFESMCQLSTGAVIAPGLVMPYLSNAQMQTVIFDDGGQPLRVTSERSFRGRLRRAIQVRDRHCQHPCGCDVPIAECDVDHIQPKAEGGETSLTNGRLQCTTHNRNHTLHNLAPP